MSPGGAVRELIGTRIGSYLVERRIGHGGMGDVYQLLQPDIGKRMAAKVLHAEFALRPDISERFFNEARATSLIDHPGIVEVFDHGQLDDGRPYLLMELLDGQSLAELIDSQGAMALADVQRIVGEVGSALSAAHARGIVHRDLKPDNLFITRSGKTKVLDFGIAKLSTALRSGQIPTRTGELLGTPRYMAPEQATGRVRDIDARTDVYALGAVVYEMVTGRPPFASRTLAQLIEDQQAKHPKSPTLLRRSLDQSWAQVIAKAMAKPREERFASVADFSRAIAEAEREPVVMTAGPDQPTAISAHEKTTPVVDMAAYPALAQSAGDKTLPGPGPVGTPAQRSGPTPAARKAASPGQAMTTPLRPARSAEADTVVASGPARSAEAETVVARGPASRGPLQPSASAATDQKQRPPIGRRWSWLLLAAALTATVVALRWLSE